MQTSQLHTLKSILTEGVRIEGNDTPIQISCIYIPRIQRAYAQGRKEEVDVRNDFLNVLFDVLVSKEDKYIELSFLFGSLQDCPTGRGFELLDGQQRTTTLFLLYWYIGMKEHGVAPEFLSRFTYETRDTSIQFLKNITSVNSKIDINDNIPSEAIKDNKWFTDEYYCDATVCAMLNMLDSIDHQYKKRNCESLQDNLERLRFYVLMLEKFDMNDELYIKMNSRGLSLVPFENFKASIVRFMKDKKRSGQYGDDTVEDGVCPFWFGFITKMDAKWIDLFWKCDVSDGGLSGKIIEIDDKKIGFRYFNFINRYLFNKSCIIDELKKSEIGSLTRFFYEVAESEKMRKRLIGWEKYETMFGIQDYFRPLEKVFDELHAHWGMIKKLIESDPYKNVDGLDIQGDDITLPQRVMLAAITEFLEHIPEGETLDSSVIKENFCKMLRVSFNIIENTAIESPIAAARVIKAIKEINAAPGATTSNFYWSLSHTPFESNNRQLKEEIAKAKEMFNSDINSYDATWEKAFCEAERHPFFKGSVFFFFTPGAGTSSDFTNRYNVVKDLFDANGITDAYKDKHILIRAIISKINTWSKGLEGRYITEVAEKEKYLKILLTGYTGVREMICDYFNHQVNKVMKSYLEDVVASASPNPNEPLDFQLLFKRLVTDQNTVALYDWISQREASSHKHFCVQNNRTYIIHIPKTWYDRIVLSTERHLIIPQLLQKYPLNYENKNQLQMMQGPIKDTTGWDVRISMDVKGLSETYKLQLRFNEWKYADFFIYGSDTDKLSLAFNVAPENKNEKRVKVAAVPYQLMASIGNIENKIKAINNTLVNL